jgi:hypothetical protein
LDREKKEKEQTKKQSVAFADRYGGYVDEFFKPYLNEIL